VDEIVRLVKQTDYFKNEISRPESQPVSKKGLSKFLENIPQKLSFKIPDSKYVNYFKYGAKQCLYPINWSKAWLKQAHYRLDSRIGLISQKAGEGYDKLGAFRKPKIAPVPIFLSGLLVLTLLLSFSLGAQAFLGNLADKSVNKLTDFGENIANGIFEQEKAIFETFNEKSKVLSFKTKEGLLSFINACDSFFDINNLSQVTIDVSVAGFYQIREISSFTTAKIDNLKAEINNFPETARDSFISLSRKNEQTKLKLKNGLVKFCRNTKQAWVSSPEIFVDQAVDLAHSSQIKVSQISQQTVERTINLAYQAPPYVSSLISGASEKKDQISQTSDTLMNKLSALPVGFQLKAYNFQSSLISSLNVFNQRLFQTADKIKDKLGDGYLKLAEWLIPGYPFEMTVNPISRTKVSQIQTEPAQQIVRITQPATRQITQQITQVTETVESVDLTEVNQKIDDLEQRIDTLFSQVSSKVNYSTPSYAPVYIPSTGLEVAGHSLLSTLNVSGSGSIGGSLSVRQNFSAGNNQDDTTTFDVYSIATFHNGLSSTGLSSTGNLSVSGSGTIKGDETIEGSLTAATTTLSQLTVSNDLLTLGNATTTGSHYIGKDLTIGGSFTPTGSSSLATTTVTGDFTVKNCNAENVHLYIENVTGNVGIATTTPDYRLSVVGNIFASTTADQLTLAYDLADNDYGTFSIDNNGDLVINLATANATTTFTDNVTIVGNLGGVSYLDIVTDVNIAGNATTTGSHYIGNDLTVDGTTTLTGDITQTGNLTLPPPKGSSLKLQDILEKT